MNHDYFAIVGKNNPENMSLCKGPTILLYTQEKLMFPCLLEIICGKLGFNFYTGFVVQPLVKFHKNSNVKHL